MIGERYLEKLIFAGAIIEAFIIVILLVVVTKQKKQLKNLSKAPISSITISITPKPVTKINSVTPYLIEKSLEIAKNLEKSSRLDYNSYLEIAKEYYRAGNLEKAIENYNKALKLNPRSAIAYKKLAEAYDEKGDLTTAEKYYLKSLELDFNPITLLDLSNMYFFKLNKKDKAISLLTNALKKSDSLSIKLRLGDYYKYLGNYEKAKYYYQLAFEQNPSDPVVKFKLKNVSPESAR